MAAGGMRRRDGGKVVVITGAGSGIGLASALHFARKGWRIGLIGRGEAALHAALAEVEALGGTGYAAAADVTDAAALERAAETIELALGPIDVWVNNAGIGFYGAFADVPPEAFRRVIEVNLFGTVNGTRVALSRMRTRNRGTIVQVLSAIAFRGVPLQTAYTASKYGLRGFTEALRTELLHDRSAVHLTMVHPPAVNTPFYSHAGSVLENSPRPPPPIYQPEIIGEAVYRAATGRRREWKVTGSTLSFVVGNILAPGLLDRGAALIGVATQQTTRPEVVGARDPNTFAPSTRAAGAHGPFDRESLSTSAQWWLSKNPAATAIGAALLLLGAAAATGRRKPDARSRPSAG